MSNFIQWANFPKILPYAQLFQQGLVVTVPHIICMPQSFRVL